MRPGVHASGCWFWNSKKPLTKSGRSKYSQVIVPLDEKTKLFGRVDPGFFFSRGCSNVGMPDPRAFPGVEVRAACNRRGCPNEGVCGSGETLFIFANSNWAFSDFQFHFEVIILYSFELQEGFYRGRGWWLSLGRFLRRFSFRLVSGTIAEGPPGFCHHQTSQLLLRPL